MKKRVLILLALLVLSSVILVYSGNFKSGKIILDSNEQFDSTGKMALNYNDKVNSSRGLVNSNEMKVGDTFCLVNGRKVKVTGVEDIVNNDNLNFFANGVLVHNKKLGALKKPSYLRELRKYEDVAKIKRTTLEKSLEELKDTVTNNPFIQKDYDGFLQAIPGREVEAKLPLKLKLDSDKNIISTGENIKMRVNFQGGLEDLLDSGPGHIVGRHIPGDVSLKIRDMKDEFAGLFFEVSPQKTLEEGGARIMSGGEIALKIKKSLESGNLKLNKVLELEKMVDGSSIQKFSLVDETENLQIIIEGCGESKKIIAAYPRKSDILTPKGMSKNNFRKLLEGPYKVEVTSNGERIITPEVLQ